MSRSMWVRFLFGRAIWVAFLIYTISLLVFWMMMSAGDPAAAIAGPRASAEAIENVRVQYGLNAPIIVQHARYLTSFFQGDLGVSLSLYRGQPAWDLLVPRMRISFQLGIASMLISFGIGIPLGTLAAISHVPWLMPFGGKGRKLFDTPLVATMLVPHAIPALISVPALMFALVIWKRWLPASGWEGLFSKHAIIPVLALSLGGIVGVAMLVRASILHNLEENYVVMARAKGVSTPRIVTGHILRNSLLPLVTGLQGILLLFLGGSYFVELLYGIPGMQVMLLRAIAARDFAVHLPVVLLTVIFFIVNVTLVDIAYTKIDPRVTLQGRK